MGRTLPGSRAPTSHRRPPRPGRRGGRRRPGRGAHRAARRDRPRPAQRTALPAGHAPVRPARRRRGHPRPAPHPDPGDGRHRQRTRRRHPHPGRPARHRPATPPPPTQAAARRRRLTTANQRPAPPPRADPKEDIVHTPPPQPPPLPQLRRVRWAVRCTLVLGVAASVAANVLHARPDPVAQIIAAWPPLALLLTVELISRVPVDRRLLAAARLVATTGIAAIAAWVSYWHMAGVASRYGEQGASPYLLPLSVDGLAIVASVSLVELAGRIRTAEHTTPRPVPAAAPAPTAIQNAVAWVQPGQPGRPDANPVVAVGRASFGGPAAHE